LSVFNTVFLGDIDYELPGQVPGIVFLKKVSPGRVCFSIMVVVYKYWRVAINQDKGPVPVPAWVQFLKIFKKIFNFNTPFSGFGCFSIYRCEFLLARFNQGPAHPVPFEKIYRYSSENGQLACSILKCPIYDQHPGIIRPS